MFRFYMPLVFIVLFFIWLLYRLFIKQDLRKHVDTIYLGLFFIGVWLLIYYWLIAD